MGAKEMRRSLPACPPRTLAKGAVALPFSHRAKHGQGQMKDAKEPLPLPPLRPSSALLAQLWTSIGVLAPPHATPHPLPLCTQSPHLPNPALGSLEHPRPSKSPHHRHFAHSPHTGSHHTSPPSTPTSTPASPHPCWWHTTPASLRRHPHRHPPTHRHPAPPHSPHLASACCRLMWM